MGDAPSPIRSPLLDGIAHGFMTREGGVSTGIVAGLNVGTLIGGALIVEVVFSLPGMGLLIFEAISRRQIVAFQSMIAVVAILYILVNFIVDLLYTVLDPRIRRTDAE